MKKFLLFLILIIALVFIASRYYYNTGLEVKEYTIKSEVLSKGYKGFKIVHFTDLLLDNTKDLKTVSHLVDSINEQNADIIVFTGDLIKSTLSDNKQTELIEILSKLQCNYYKYAILGDHDTLDSKEILTDSSFKLLDNEVDYIYQNDRNPIIIAGGNKLEELTLDDVYAYRIALIHKPDYFKDINTLGFNLVLAGHSLGGQIRVPFYGSLLKKDGAKIYTNDYYKENGSIMYISYGIGNEKTNLRFLNKPSYNIYRLYSK